MTDQTIVVTPAISTPYCVTVTDQQGCTDSSCVIVYVKPVDCSDNIYVPNAFSPNEDVENDLFRVYFINITCVEDFKISIYDRWGDLVYGSTDPAFAWAGDYKSKLMDSAVFTWYLDIQFKGVLSHKKGNVSLVR